MNSGMLLLQIPLLLTVAIAIVLFRNHNALIAPDRKIMAKLKAQGLDFSQPHQIGFVLYFPSEETASQAAGDLKKEGYDTTMEKSADGVAWCLRAQTAMILHENKLGLIRRTFTCLAMNHQGYYDGWNVEGIKPPVD